MRTFISFDPPADIRQEMKSLQEELMLSGADVSWELPHQLHSTIKFLGEVRQEVMPELLSALRSIASQFHPMPISYERLGGFPDLHRPRVIWIGCTDDDGNLARLKNEIDTKFVPLGFALEDRAFHPHVTLGRVKSSRNLQHLTPILEKRTFERRRATIESFFVMKSVLQPRGAVYSVIDTIHLAT
ncbi:MAG TPA: RNA 2',3'-cyclic phosphodiesterase [Bacteroidota bacterium]|nr:RNA 2',3'-cyclic phosphodiesterase [Bacteroidota bacterium]